MNTRWKFATAALAVSLASISTPAMAEFLVTYEAPGVQTSSATFSLEGMETFDGISAGNGQSFTTDFGTGGVISGSYSNVDIRTADVYGGAGGNTNFASTSSSTGYSLTLTTTDPKGINYFGYWLSALDSGNNVAFYNGAALVYSFSAGDVASLLGSGYGGNPNAPFTGGNGGQDYAFLNFFDKTGTFDKVVFSENPEIGGYESDNHTVGFFTSTSGTPVGGAVPEPATWAMMIGGVGVAGSMMRRRAKVSRAAFA